MLVLSRHRDESIVIGDDVIVTVVDIRGDKVRLGINAPQAVPVHRQEVFDAICRDATQCATEGILIDRVCLERWERNRRLAAYYQNLLNDLANDCVRAARMDPDDESPTAEAAREIVTAGVLVESASAKVLSLAAGVA